MGSHPAHGTRNRTRLQVELRFLVGVVALKDELLVATWRRWPPSLSSESREETILRRDGDELQGPLDDINCEETRVSMYESMSVK